MLALHAVLDALIPQCTVPVSDIELRVEVSSL